MATGLCDVSAYPRSSEHRIQRPLFMMFHIPGNRLYQSGYMVQNVHVQLLLSVSSQQLALVVMCLYNGSACVRIDAHVHGVRDVGYAMVQVAL